MSSVESNLSWESIYAVLNKIDRRLDRLDKAAPRFIPRSRIIKEIGRANYDYGVSSGRLNELKGPARNSKVLIERIQYENYLLLMQK